MMKRRFLILYFLIAFASIASNTYSTTKSFVFEPFSLNDKLSSNSVTRTFQDRDGYVWFGTKDGLCRFDGYDIKVFRSSALTPGKLTNNEIECLAEDNSGKLWIGTMEGINILDKRSFSLKPYESRFTKNERINSILCDSEGNIWIATSNYGVLKVNPQNGESERFSKDADSRFKLKSNNISHIYEDRDGNIWILSWKAGLCFISKGEKSLHFLPETGASNNPFRLFQDKDGLYWICTWGDGVYTMTLDKSNKTEILPLKLSTSSSPIDKIVYSIIQDNKYGHIWIVTFSGLYLIEKEQNNAYTLQEAKNYVGETSGGIFHEIYKDRNGNLWLGTLGEGLYRLDLRNLPFENYTLNENANTVNSFVTHFCETGSGNLYVALDRKGLHRFDIKSKKLSRISNTQLAGLSSICAVAGIRGTNEIWIANEGNGIVYVFEESGQSLNLKSTFLLKGNDDTSIQVFFEDRNRDVWIGSNSGLYKKTFNGNVEFIPLDLRFVNTIGEDMSGNIWVGTEKNGLFILKKSKNSSGKTIYTARRIVLKKNNFESHSIQSIYSTKKGDIYTGTKEGYIFQYDNAGGKITEISGQYGITDEKVLDIIEDNFGNLWISTTKQIIRHNPASRASSYFSTSNGVLISSFYKNSRIKLKNGLIMFGGNKGICAFDASIQQVPSAPVDYRVELTDILVQNKSIFEEDLNRLYNPKRNKVTLKFSEKNLGIEFSVLDYISASNTQYAYKLAGVDSKWNYVGNNRRFVNYADLNEGSYTFSVKATDENGVWSNIITTLEIQILPPFYRTRWAYLLYLVALLAILFSLYRNITNRIRLKNDLRISKIEKEKSEELVQTKLRYFTNITHELLTPLTIIMLDIEKLQKRLSDSPPTQFDVIKENVHRLRRLIEQILYFRKVESGNMKLKVSRGDIIAFTDRICRLNFKTLLDNKGIDFSFSANHHQYDAYFDHDKIDKIIYNLLSNAYKHTPQGGSIHVNVAIYTKDDTDYMSFQVTDTGDGIDEKDLPHIFDRFYITTTSDQSQSHGIGLALTHDLIKLHKGDIDVKSKLNQGTTFVFNIPVSPGSFSEDEILPQNKDTQTESVKVSENVSAKTITEATDETPAKDLTLLIVEDNKDLREIMRDNFEKKYNVITAENGIQAMNLIHETDADIVISDVMMPEMDGLTFCRMMKNDIKTSHISILMLTARDSAQDRIDCYEAGADGYISKPFEMNVLEARVKNLISSRSQKIKRFQLNHDVSITNMEYNSIDEEYLKTAISKVEDKLADETYDFEHFAMDMSSSKSTLHRKLKSLTGLSPWEFIRNIRLKHAAQMLKNNVGNVSEIAFKVGFNDPKYFSRCFKAEFGMTPKEFQDMNKD